VGWYATASGQHDYHASLDGKRSLCRSRDKLLEKDSRGSPDPSKDPWTCPTCQGLVRRVEPRVMVPIKVLNRVLARAWTHQR
jgi:hypothetical protein